MLTVNIYFSVYTGYFSKCFLTRNNHIIILFILLMRKYRHGDAEEFNTNLEH